MFAKTIESFAGGMGARGSLVFGQSILRLFTNASVIIYHVQALYAAGK